MAKAWAIRSGGRRNSLYEGTGPTKTIAIARHVWAYDETLFNAGWPHSCKNLSDRQKAVWKKCQERGDVAVRVVIQESAP